MTDAFIHAKEIVTKLVRSGYETYFAGGWVRDFIMEHPSDDIDIATSATPSEIMDLFPHTLLVGLAFGVVIVLMEGHQFEVATFRKDLPYVDGRHPQGIEKSTPYEDAKRRDFTINGMFYDPLENKIHDYVQGQEDIKKGLIRAIGDPYERFFEDRLRMLRAFRFSSRFAFAIDSETKEAIRENADKLFPAVAMERVWQEFKKMSAYQRFDHALVEMHQLTLLDVIFPEIAGMHVKELKNLVSHFSHFPPGSPTIFYLMEILQTLPFQKRIEIANRLKVSNKEIKLAEYMHALNEQVDKLDIDLVKWTDLFAHENAKLCLKVLAARTQKSFAEYEALYEKLHVHIERKKTNKPLVTAAMLEKMGVLPGKQMGVLLKEAERIAIEENWDDPIPVLERLKKFQV